MERAPNQPLSPCASGSRSAEDLLVLASEELRGPLTSVSGYLQVLLDGEVGDLEPGQERVAGIAARSAERMERLLDALIVVAQLHAGIPASHPVDVAALVNDRAGQARHAAHARGVSLGVACEVTRPLHGDVTSLGQALDGLIDHALTFSRAGDSVEVIARDCSKGISLEVHDHGVPPEPDHVDDLFAGRAGSAAAGPRVLLGSKLGLFMVRVVAEAHGGVAEATRYGDERTRLRMVLPSSRGPVGRLRG